MCDQTCTSHARNNHNTEETWRSAASRRAAPFTLSLDGISQQGQLTIHPPTHPSSINLSSVHPHIHPSVHLSIPPSVNVASVCPHNHPSIHHEVSLPGSFKQIEAPIFIHPFHSLVNSDCCDPPYAELRTHRHVFIPPWNPWNSFLQLDWELWGDRSCSSFPACPPGTWPGPQNGHLVHIHRLERSSSCSFLLLPPPRAEKEPGRKGKGPVDKATRTRWQRWAHRPVKQWHSGVRANPLPVMLPTPSALHPPAPCPDPAAAPGSGSLRSSRPSLWDWLRVTGCHGVRWPHAHPVWCHDPGTPSPLPGTLHSPACRWWSGRERKGAGPAQEHGSPASIWLLGCHCSGD